jgi:hypothetical protein
MPRWNEMPISGSFLDWKMLGHLVLQGVENLGVRLNFSR